MGEEACDEEMEAKASTMTFYDMFEAADISEEGAACPAGYTSLNSQPGGAECLKLKPGMEKYASRFEFRRHATDRLRARVPSVESVADCSLKRWWIESGW